MDSTLPQSIERLSAGLAALYKWTDNELAIVRKQSAEVVSELTEGLKQLDFRVANGDELLFESFENVQNARCRMGE